MNEATPRPTSPEVLAKAPGRRSAVGALRAMFYGLAALAVFASVPEERAGEPERKTSAATTARKAPAVVIGGGGELKGPVHDRFLALAGGEEASVVFIPTASEKADTMAKDFDYYGWKSRVKCFTILHTRDRKKANDPDFVKPLKAATGAWIRGGDQNKLIEAYGGTEVERELHRLLDRGGVVGGSSAGAAVQSRKAITGGKTVATLGTGFGLADRFLSPYNVRPVCDQHFENRGRKGRLLGVLSDDEVGIGVNEDTAAVCQGTTLSVLGKSNVLICRPGSKPYVLKPGESLDFKSIFSTAAEKTQPMSEKTLAMPPH